MKRALIVLALLASGCSKVEGDPRICARPVDLMKATIAHDAQRTKDPGELVERAQTWTSACLQSNAYRLAKAPDAALVVAAAVADMCSMQTVSLSGAEAALYRSQGLPAETTTDADAKNEALVDVLTARAGHCPPS